MGHTFLRCSDQDVKTGTIESLQPSAPAKAAVQKVARSGLLKAVAVSDTISKIPITDNSVSG